MKTVVRRSVFETNSSSVHTLSIIKNPEHFEIPEQVTIDTSAYFGWGRELFTDLNSKLSYIWLAIDDFWYFRDMPYEETLKKREELHNTFKQKLLECGVKEINVIDSDSVTFNGVDHGDEAEEFIEAIFSDMDLFKNFLFDSKSYIYTTNDNEEDYDKLEMQNNEPSTTFYKYN